MFLDESFRNCFVKVEPFTSSRAYTTIISDPGISCAKSKIRLQGQSNLSEHSLSKGT